MDSSGSRYERALIEVDLARKEAWILGHYAAQLGPAWTVSTKRQELALLELLEAHNALGAGIFGEDY